MLKKVNKSGLRKKQYTKLQKQEMKSKILMFGMQFQEVEKQKSSDLHEIWIKNQNKNSKS